MSFGNYTRHLNTQDDPFNTRVRANLDGTLDSLPDTPENASAETIKKYAEHFLAEEATRVDGFRAREDVNAFLALHPEYKDTPANAALMNHELKRMGVTINPTLEQNDAAYRSLRESNFLDLDKKVLAKQEAEAAKQRAEDFKNRHVHTEDEMNAMSMDELRMRGNGVIR